MQLPIIILQAMGSWARDWEWGYQYHASSAALGWLRNENCYHMHWMQSGDWPCPRSSSAGLSESDESRPCLKTLSCTICYYIAIGTHKSVRQPKKERKTCKHIYCKFKANSVGLNCVCIAPFPGFYSQQFRFRVYHWTQIGETRRQAVLSRR